MIKKHTILSILTCLIIVPTIIGTGFALWDFSNNNSFQIKVDVLITSSQKVGNFSFNLPTVVCLDEGNTTTNGFASTLTGISFYKEEMSPHTNKLEPVIDTNFSIVFTEKENLDNSIKGDSLIFGYRLSISGLLSNYITLNQTYYSQEKLEIQNNDNLETQYKDLKNFNNSDGSNYTYSNGIHTFNINSALLDSFFSYKEGCTPSTFSKYQNLKKEIDESQETNPSYFLIEVIQGGK